MPQRMNYNRPQFQPRGETSAEEWARAQAYIRGAEGRDNPRPFGHAAWGATTCRRCSQIIVKGQRQIAWDALDRSKGWRHADPDHCRANGWDG